MERLGALDLPWVMLALRRLMAVAGVMGMVLSLMVWGYISGWVEGFEAQNKPISTVWALF